MQPCFKADSPLSTAQGASKNMQNLQAQKRLSAANSDFLNF
jgi:hypothetical protein